MDGTYDGKKCCFCCSPRLASILRLLRIRVILIAYAVVTILFLTCTTRETTFMYTFIVVAAILVETVYIILRNNGRDFYWFSVTSFSYSVLFMAVYWKASWYKHHVLDDECLNSNETGPYIFESCLQTSINLCEILYLLMSIFLFTLVISKWWTPISQKQSVKAQINLFTAFLSASADFFDLIDYNNIDAITHKIGINSITLIACLSLFQFSFNLAAIKKDSSNLTSRVKFIFDFFFCTEAWAEILVVLTQDMPSLILRTYILAECGFFVHLTLYFFTLKNLLLVIVAYFKCALLFKEFKEKRSRKLELVSIEEKVESKNKLAKNKVDVAEIPQSDFEKEKPRNLKQQENFVKTGLEEMTYQDEVRCSV